MWQMANIHFVCVSIDALLTTAGFSVVVVRMGLIVVTQVLVHLQGNFNPILTAITEERVIVVGKAFDQSVDGILFVFYLELPCR